jgi:diguanylate cyclase (GGDEF)-like protein
MMQTLAPGIFSGSAGWLNAMLGGGLLIALLLALAVFSVTGLLLIRDRRRLQRIRLRRGRPAEVDFVRPAREAGRDPLTGLAGRGAFLQTLADSLNAARPFALILIDLDGFGALNRVHGVQFADGVLGAAASRLRPLAADPSRLARIGNDEFALLLDAPPDADVEMLALRIRRALAAPLFAGQQLIDPRASLGIALAPSHADTVDGLLRAAHVAMTQVRASGGGSWRFYDKQADAALRARDQLKMELRDAIAAGQIVPFYQPIMDLRRNALTGLEVLARWEHPNRGVLSPDLFIPMAEEMHMAGEITQLLMRRVIFDSRDWPTWLYFAFNVSPGQMRELIGMIRTPPAWPEGELDPHRIEVELTESALAGDLETAREVVSLLQAQGTRVVLDDFGTGFSNFFRLRELPFDRIKIDRSFVLDLEHDTRAEACVRAMLTLAASLGIDVVAEGLERAETETCVAALGCRYGQGFLYSPPVAAPAVPGLVRRLQPGREPAPKPAGRELVLFNAVP